MKRRLDQEMVARELVNSRSQAESFICLGKVEVNGKLAQKTGLMVESNDKVKLLVEEQYVSRAGLKLASVAEFLDVNFHQKTVLDVGSSTGGFTDYALKHGAQKVVAVDVGTEQLHPSLRGDMRIELHEKTDVRTLKLAELPDVIVIDVSFISLREILPYVANFLASQQTQIIAMAKPQFEAGRDQVNKGVIKNDKIRRQILADFEAWSRDRFVIVNKRDSDVAGARGNQERFYLLRVATKPIS